MNQVVFRIDNDHFPNLLKNIKQNKPPHDLSSHAYHVLALAVPFFSYSFLPLYNISLQLHPLKVLYMVAYARFSCIHTVQLMTRKMRTTSAAEQLRRSISLMH